MHHGYLSSEDASSMWGYYQLPYYQVPTLPMCGPQVMYRTIGDEQWNEDVSNLAESVRDLCIYDLQHVHIAYIVSRKIRHQSKDRLQQLAKRYYLINSRSVCDYLKAHDFLIPILFELRKKIDQYFSSDTLSNLELFTDPEDDNSASKLFALILTSLSSDDASTRLEQLDEEWWLDQPREVRRVLSIDVDYINGV